MKRILFFIVATFVAFTSCAKFDDTQIWDKLNDHEERIVALEALCGQMNTNIASLQTIIQALQENDYIINVVAIMENGIEVGYQITFSKGNTVTIYHGKDGLDGAPGTDGKDGINGTDGKDGQDGMTPVIGVKQDTDGTYYWTLNGEWMLDDNGNKIPTTGKDGKDGTDGKDGLDGTNGSDGKDGVDGTPGDDGMDGITPQLKIEENYWYISYDNGTTWTRLGKATGEDGKDGLDGAPGEDGKDGTDGKDGVDGMDGDTMFANVNVDNPDYIIFTLADGTMFKIPTWKAFEELKTKVEQMNKNIEALQAIASALQNNDYVTDITPIYDGVEEIGYIINFSKSGKVTIYHGKDGINGTDGKDGQDGMTPVIGVKQDTDGTYYWTLNGEWMLDDNGNKIPTTGKDGKDGTDGKDGLDGTNGSDGKDGVDGTPGDDGMDGITPQLKIEENYWYISYDNGTTWTRLGKATGEDGKDGQDGSPGAEGTPGKDGDSFFQSVSKDDYYVYLMLADSSVIKIPIYTSSSTDVPQIGNSYIRPKSKDEPIKILCFGSSWFHNTWWYLNKITSSLGINAEIHGYDLGSSCFDEWIDLYNNDLSPFTGSLSWRGAYRYVSINGEDYTCSERVAGSEFGDQEYRDAWYEDLVSEDWDIIAFQQGAIQAPKWEYWERGPELVSIIKRHCGPNTMIAFNSTWTPSVTSPYIPNATDGLCSKTLEGQKLWQTMNSDNCKRFMNITGVNNVAPNGAMIYTLRRDQKINSNGDDLCHDGLHPNHGLPMFAIASVFYETCIAPFYGISIKECTWLPSSSDKRVPFNSSVFRPVSEAQRDRIYEYVRISLSNRFGFNEPFPYEEESSNNAEE